MHWSMKCWYHLEFGSIDCSKFHTEFSFFPIKKLYYLIESKVVWINENLAKEYCFFKKNCGPYEVPIVTDWEFFFFATELKQIWLYVVHTMYLSIICIFKSVYVSKMEILILLCVDLIVFFSAAFNFAGEHF